MSNLAGMHDRESTSLGITDTWALDTVALSENPTMPTYNPSYNWIARLNWGYGSTGTLPLPKDYLGFSEIVREYVRGSKNCSRWQIGNEPSLSREWPNNQPIFPWLYAQCYTLCRDAIHSLPGHEHDEVLIAASGPWNNELKYNGNVNGDWIFNFEDVIHNCDYIDGFVLHSYCHGYNLSLVTSTARMNPPFQNRYYEFLTYRDYMEAIPDSLKHLPVYIGEANGNGPWQAVGLMPAMLKEINDWNKSGKQPIKSVIFYRYPHYDDYFIEGKADVIAEYREAVEKGYKVPEIHLPQIEQPSGPTATVIATAGANIRSGPGKNYTTLGAIALGISLKITGKSLDGSWWQIESKFGKGWVSRVVVDASNVQNVPIVTVTVPIPDTPPTEDNWQKSYAFIRKWEGGFQNIYNDSGNWTGGVVGKGELKGTNFGVSAASYPNLDIRNITPEQAEHIFLIDYWQKSGASTLSYPACLVVLDTAVLHGVGAAKVWLTEAGPNAYIFVARRLRSYLKAENWEFWDEAWIGRVIDLLEYVGKSI